MKKINPISLLADELLKAKNYLDTKMNSGEQIITKEFLEDLEKETFQVLNSCKELNSDGNFIEKVNARFDLTVKNALYKTQQIFISELLKIYTTNKVTDKKAQFVLAYYYDVLRNERFADPSDLTFYNDLLAQNAFDDIVRKILVENQLKSLTVDDHNILLSVMSQLSSPKLHQFKDYFKNFRAKSNIIVEEEVIQEMLSQETSSEEIKININVTPPPPEDNLEKVMADLNALIGLENVKQDITMLINLLNIQKKREVAGLKNIEVALHSVFLGPPGTGKTTVARLLGRIFKQLDYLTQGQMYETDREGLIAGYVGQTAIKTDQVIKESIGGVLFIDEAYSLYQNQGTNDFGSEAINTIVKRMEDNRDDLAVVVAGYTGPMEIFINSNPGLRSRFNRYFYFNHFTTDQLILIFESFCSKSDFDLSADAKEKLRDTFSLMDGIKSESFGNARVVRNLFEKIVQSQANRLINWSAPNAEVLKTILEEDIPEPSATMQSLKDQFIQDDADEEKVEE